MEDFEWIKKTKINPLIVGTLIFISPLDTDAVQWPHVSTKYHPYGSPEQYVVLQITNVTEKMVKYKVLVTTMESNAGEHSETGRVHAEDLIHNGYWRVLDNNVPKEYITPKPSHEDFNQSIRSKKFLPYIVFDGEKMDLDQLNESNDFEWIGNIDPREWDGLKFYHKSNPELIYTINDSGGETVDVVWSVGELSDKRWKRTVYPKSEVEINVTEGLWIIVDKPINEENDFEWIKNENPLDSIFNGYVFIDNDTNDPNMGEIQDIMFRYGYIWYGDSIPKRHTPFEKYGQRMEGISTDETVDREHQTDYEMGFYSDPNNYYKKEKYNAIKNGVYYKASDILRMSKENPVTKNEWGDLYESNDFEWIKNVKPDRNTPQKGFIYRYYDYADGFRGIYDDIDTDDIIITAVTGDNVYFDTVNRYWANHPHDPGSDSLYIDSFNNGVRRGDIQYLGISNINESSDDLGWIQDIEPGVELKPNTGYFFEPNLNMEEIVVLANKIMNSQYLKGFLLNLTNENSNNYNTVKRDGLKYFVTGNDVTKGPVEGWCTDTPLYEMKRMYTEEQIIDGRKELGI
jgi:hypothetical protein